MYNLRVLSLGAGVQSTTLALMAAHGELDMPDCAIFADTQWEPARVYRNLDWLCSGILPFPVHRVTNGDLLDHAISNKRDGGFMVIPAFSDLGGMSRRQCTGDFKINPIRKKIREILGIKPKSRVPRDVRVEIIIGISLDEKRRMRPSQHRWIDHKYPLIDKRMTRYECIAWMTNHGYQVPPKSSCIGCPYHSNQTWDEIKRQDPESWAAAVEADEALRGSDPNKPKHYLHQSCVPLSEAEFPTPRGYGQADLFMECEGMCGT